MVNFGDWMQQNVSPSGESNRAVRVWLLIQRTPTVITILRNAGSTGLLNAQTVRVEPSNTEREFKGSSADGIVRDIVIFGVRNHPDENVLDTDIRRGDLFELDVHEYKVIQVMYVPGGVQAYAEAIS